MKTRSKEGEIKINSKQIQKLTQMNKRLREELKKLNSDLDEALKKAKIKNKPKDGYKKAEGADEKKLQMAHKQIESLKAQIKKYERQKDNIPNFDK